MIDPRKERIQHLLDSASLGRLTRRDLLSGLTAATAAGLLAPASLQQALAAGETQTANGRTPRGAYDYIVVGAGSAGCAVARRILDRTAATVLVIEAGGDERGIPEIDDPTKWVANIGSARDWGYLYTPTERVANRGILLSRGKVLGGSSSINGLLWMRGAPADYDGWSAAGAKGWDWKSVLPVLRQMEDWEDGASALRGAGGPTRVERAKDLHRIAAAFIDAGKGLGMAHLDDLNGPTNLGVGAANMNVRDGTRDNAFRAYLRPVLGNERLTVLPQAKVTRLVFDGTTCTGVDLLTADGTRTVRASSEVVLCAGAIDSPRLLMLSGIGPADQLKGVGITPLLDLPGVGQNLHDHLIVGGMVYETHMPMTPFNNNLEGSMLFAKSTGDRAVPDIMFIPIQIPYLMPELAAEMKPPANAMTFAPGIGTVASRGYLRMLSDRHDGPLDIQPNILQEQADLDALVAGFDLGLELARQPAFRDVIKGPVAPPKRDLTRAEKEAFLRRAVSTYFHPVGTCKMGVDAMAVVDPTLKVRGVERLRVADASVMPTITSVHTNAPSVLIGEMAAGFITR